MPRIIPRPLALLLTLSLVLVAGCASQPPRAPKKARSPDAATESAREAGAPVDSTAAARPVSAKTGDDVLFPPAPAGIYTVSVPAIVSEPAQIMSPRPLAPEHEGIVAVDEPKPARRRPRGRGVPVNQAVVVGPSEPSSASVAVSSGVVGETPEPLAPALLDSFDSLEFDDNGPNTGQFFIPPDAHGAAGTSHVVSVVNTALQIHTKDGTPLLDTVAGDPKTGVSLASFFATESPLTQTFDPKVLYDQFADRWVVVTLEFTDVVFGDAADTSKIFVAVSDTDDPTGSWTTTTIPVVISATRSGSCPSPTPSWADYPGFAVDEEAVYITANIFGFFTYGAPYCGVRLWILDKGLGSGGFYDGGAASVTVNNPYTAGGSVSTTTQPAHVYCTPGATCPATTGTYLVSYSGLTDGSNEYLQFVRVDDPVGTPGFTQQFLNLDDIEPLSSDIPSAPQSGSVFPIATNDRRALDAVWRDGSLWLTSTIDPNAATSAADAGEATAAFWEIDTTGADPNFASLVQQGLISGDGDIATDAYTFFPSIAVNAGGDVTIGFSASAASIFPGSYYTTQASSVSGGTTTTPVVLRAGLDTYERTFDDTAPCNEADSRWGDYSAAAVDPADQCFWVYNEHAIARGTPLDGVCGDLTPVGKENGRWGTAFGKLCIDCATSPITISTATTGTDSYRGPEITVTGGGDVAASGDLTLQGQTIEFQNGFKAEGPLSVFTGFCPPLPP